MTKYILLKTTDLTTQMLNRSLCNSVDELPEYTSTNRILYVFPSTVNFYVLEFDVEQTKGSTCFDNYPWYMRKEIRDIIIENLSG